LKKIAMLQAFVVLLAAIFALAMPQAPDAAALYREKKFTEAARALEHRLKSHPDDEASRLLLGLCYQQAGDAGRAAAVFTDAVRRRPTGAAARFFLARVQYLLNEFDQAEENARLAIRLGGPPARAYNLIGLILIEKNAYEKALEAFAAAVRSGPEGFPEADLNAGVLLLKMGRAPEALKRLDLAVKANPQSAEALYHRARAWLELNRPAEAERDLAAVLSLGPNPQAANLLEQIRRGSGAGRVSRAAVRAGAEAAPIRFRDVAESAGLRFAVENHPTPQKHLIETMPGGVAAFDYNGDGLIDIYFTNGADIPSLEKTSPRYWNRLYRNDGGMKFTDVTAEAGVAGAGYSMGAAAADYDNDGHVDLFVAGVNRNILFHNTGRGKFEDVTARAGIKSGGWSVAAGWLDYDNDGLLDLFVVNYVKWPPAPERECSDPAGLLRVYCHPMYFEGLPNTLYRNRGDGTFEDVSVRSGIAAHAGKGMSAAFADYDLDGWMDIFVANDAMPNFLFHNRGGAFEEVALQAGTALPDDGKAVSGMGTDFRDYDNDGLPDVAFTALAGETFPLFHNQGKGFFRDATYPSRIGLLSAPRSGWSAGLFDFNNDGWKDLFASGSHVMDNIDLFRPQKYRQPNSIFANLGNGTFQDVSGGAGRDFQTPRAHRGSAFADFNNDGRIDVVVSALGEPAELWENTSPGENHWIRLKLEGTRSNRDGIGARVRLLDQANHMTTAVGYASSSHDGVHFGTGRVGVIGRIEIVWPSGVVQVLENVKTGQVLRVREPAP
jgi:tetratricopeptide (TPR) repeat protein